MSRSGSLHQIQPKTARSNSFNNPQYYNRPNSQAKTQRINSVVLTPQELIQMKLRANLINGPINQHQSIELMQKSKQRISKWPDNRNDYKKRFEEKRWKKFEQQELERRKIDAEQAERQRLIKQKTILQANQKIFQQQQKVKALNTQLLYADAVQVRERQIQNKILRKQQDKQQQVIYHEMVKQNVKRLEQIQKKEKQDQINKNKVFAKNIKKQNKQFKKQYINKIKEQMEEGALLTIKAQQAIQEQQRVRKAKRASEVANKQQANRINQENKKKKEQQKKRQQQEALRIIEHKKKQQKALQIQKQRQKQLIQQKIRAREDHYVKQLAKTQSMNSTKKSWQNSIHEKQLKQIKQKQAQKQRKKAEQLSKLKKQFDYSLQLQLQRKKKEQQEELAKKKQFDEVWKKQLDGLNKMQQQQIEFARLQNIKHKQVIKKQIEQKQKIRDEKYKQELQQVENQKKQLELEDGQFKSYAQKTIKQWANNGKTIYPMIRHLATWKQI